MKPAQFNQIRKALGSFYWDNDFETFCRVTGFNPQFPYAEEKWGGADFSYEIERGRRAERASPAQFHSRIKQCQKWQQFITCVQLMGQFDDATWGKIVSASFANQR